MLKQFERQTLFWSKNIRANELAKATRAVEKKKTFLLICVIIDMPSKYVMKVATFRMIPFKKKLNPNWSTRAKGA